MASTELMNLKDLFNGKFLRIPDYQRGYAWQEHQLKDFWEDLMNLEEKQVHYTGVITVEMVSQEKKVEKPDLWKSDYGTFESDDVFFIVDGQQRLTTAVILIKAMLEEAIKRKIRGLDGQKIEKLYEKYISEENINGFRTYFFGYTSDNPSYEFLKTKIFGERSSENQNIETFYTANLEHAKTFFDEKVRQLEANELDPLFTKLTRYFKFNLYEISDDLDVFVAFETMNNRGKPLSNLELLKNRLIYLSTKFKDKDKEQLRKDINECWKTVYEYLGKNKNNPLSDDRFLKNHWIMYHDYSRKKGNDYIVDLLDERYTLQQLMHGDLTIKDIREYVLSLKESVEHWYYLHNPARAPYADKIKFWLDKLHRLNYGAFAPVLMAIFSRDDRYDHEKLFDLLQLMEKYLFLIFKISQRRSNTGDSEFYGYAKKYHEGKMTIEEMIGECNEENDMYSGINWWLASYYDLSQFKNYLKEKFEKREGYYSWNGLSYFLYEYELSLRGKNYENRINWEEYTNTKADYRSIEHILPQDASKECWRKAFGKFDKAKLKAITNSLGNLVPLSSPKNSQLRNACFGKKKEKGFKNGSYAEQEINESKTWTYKEIEKRGKKLLQFLADNWDVREFNDERMKREYLFLPKRGNANFPD